MQQSKFYTRNWTHELIDVYCTEKHVDGTLVAGVHDIILKLAVGKDNEILPHIINCQVMPAVGVSVTIKIWSCEMALLSWGYGMKINGNELFLGTRNN